MGEKARLRLASHQRQRAGIRGEGLAYSPSGEVLDSISTVFIQGDLPHSGGAYRPVRNIDVTRGTVEFYVDVAYNGFLLYPYGKGVYHGARLATRDEEAYSLYYDYLTLLVLAGHTDDAALANDLRAALRAAFARFTSGDIPAARAVLAEQLTRPSTDDFVYSAIGHGHLDMAWLWPLRETRRKAARTYTKALNTVDQRDGYLYGTSQPQQLAWMKEEQPELFERLKAAVAAGRIELQGTFWIEPDTNLPSGESLVRQALVGRRFLQHEFGIAPQDLRLCWLPDTFGYNGNLPQILKKSGMDWFQTIKLAWNKVNDFPHRTFHWQGIDGSTVLVHMPPEGDYNSRGAADGLLRGLARYPEKALGTALLVYGAGDGGGGPGEVHLEVTRREHDLRGLPKVEYSTADRFFRHLETLDVPHTHTGELYLETHQGTYTTQAAIKKHNRLSERAIHEAEALAAIAGVDSRAALEQHWRDVLLNQFHDILPGSSIERVNREAVATYTRIGDALREYSAQLLGTLSSSDRPAALNLTSVSRREYLKHDGDWQVAEVGPYAAAALKPATSYEPPSFADNTMSNGMLTLRFGASGEIVSCLDAAGAEHSAGGLNRLVLHRDPYQFPFDAWDIKQDYAKTTPHTVRMTHAGTTIDGPRVTRTQVHRSRRLTIIQRIVLEADSPVVMFHTEVDWHEKHRMLRAEFRPAHFGGTAKCEIQFGHIARVTTENATGGFALLNDSKYGHRAKRGLISLNLLRSPTFPDKTADRGMHDFTYAFRPFETDDLGSVIRDAYRLNNPLGVTTGVEFGSVVTLSDPAVIVETIKGAENGDGVILRLYESLGRATTTTLTTTFPHRSALLTDLLERRLAAADLGHLALGPFEILTIHLEGPQ